MAERSLALRRVNEINTGPANPLFLISAALMMTGCYTLSHSLDLRAGGVGGLVVLIGVLNLYEATLLALGLWLIARRQRWRDGVLLLLIELLFLLDAAYLNTELVAASPGVGGAVNGASFFLAVAKVGVVAYVLGVRSRQPVLHVAAGCTGLLALFFMPGWLAAQAGGGELHVADLFAAWCVVGALLGTHTLIGVSLSHQGATKLNVGDTLIAAFFTGIYASLACHLVGLGWVYHVPFQSAFVAPSVLAVTPLLHRWLRDARVDLAIPAVAVLLAVRFSPELTSEYARVMVSPLRLMLLSSAAMYGWLGWARASWWFFLPATMTFALCLSGHTTTAIAQRWEDVWAWVVGFVKTRTPRGGVFWGCAAILAAFLTLAGGAAASVRRRPHTPDTRSG